MLIILYFYRGNALQKIRSDSDDQVNDFTGAQGLNLDGLNSLKALQEFAKKQQKEIEQQELTMAQKERKLKSVYKFELNFLNIFVVLCILLDSKTKNFKLKLFIRYE